MNTTNFSGNAGNSGDNRPGKQLFMDVVVKFRQLFNKLITYIPLPLLVVGVTIVAIVILFPVSIHSPVFDLPREGDIASQTIIAPFTFDVEKMPELLERERRDAAAKVLLVVDFKDDISAQTKLQLGKLSASPMQTAFPNGTISGSSLQLLKKYPELVRRSITEALAAQNRGVLNTHIVPGAVSTDRERNDGVSVSVPLFPYDKDFVTLRKKNGETAIRYSAIPCKDVLLDSIIGTMRITGRYAPDVLAAVYECLSACIVPNVLINLGETERRMQHARQNVLSVEGKVLKETEVVRIHQVVTDDVVDKLFSLRKAQEKLNKTGILQRMLMQNVGRILFVILAFLLIVWYIQRYYGQYFKEPKMIVAFSSIIIIQLAIIRIGMFFLQRAFADGGNDYSVLPEYTIPVTIAGMLTAIFFDVNLSFVMSLFIALFFGAAFNFSMPVFVVAALSGCTAGYFCRNIRYRYDFFSALPPMLGMYGLLILITSIMQNDVSIGGLINSWLYAGVNATTAVVAAMVLTLIFERLFDFATNMTLIELADMNHPVLKRLSIEASGTYNHSVLVGNLAESAAERIGANALFARVASYYHDIGKIDKAGYFIENMTAYEKSKHHKLSPSLSALLISSHVKEGAELAKKYKLPKTIRDAITQHHGTSTVSFFYAKACEQAPNHEIAEELFKYAGPLPQTRENAIIMLADSVEAASRNLATSSPKLLRELVQRVIRDKFLAAQLDQSNLTLRELDDIHEGFMVVLQGIFHTRDFEHKEGRKYPGNPK